MPWRTALIHCFALDLLVSQLLVPLYLYRWIKYVFRSNFHYSELKLQRTLGSLKNLTFERVRTRAKVQFEEYMESGIRTKLKSQSKNLRKQMELHLAQFKITASCSTIERFIRSTLQAKLRIQKNSCHMRKLYKLHRAPCGKCCILTTCAGQLIADHNEWPNRTQ